MPHRDFCVKGGAPGSAQIFVRGGGGLPFTRAGTHYQYALALRGNGLAGAALAPGFCSDCDDLIEAASGVGVVAWIFGHHHWSQRLEVHGVKLLAAQPG